MDFEKLVQKGIFQKSTIVKYKTTERHLKGYLEWQNAGRDILLLTLTTQYRADQLKFPK